MQMIRVKLPYRKYWGLKWRRTAISVFSPNILLYVRNLAAPLNRFSLASPPQFTHKIVMDHQFVNQRFSSDGGAKQLNQVLGGQLHTVLTTFADTLWQQAA